MRRACVCQGVEIGLISVQLELTRRLRKALADDDKAQVGASLRTESSHAARCMRASRQQLTHALSWCAAQVQFAKALESAWSACRAEFDL